MAWVAYIIYIRSTWGFLEVPQIGKETSNTQKAAIKYPENISEVGFKCVRLNARIIVNMESELNIMVEDIDPHIIDINESWVKRRCIRCRIRIEFFKKKSLCG